jgi:hypothetical protein
MPDLTRLFKIVVVSVFIFLNSIILSAQPVITSSAKVSQTGYFQLKWKSEESENFILQQDTTSFFNTPKTIYSGTDTARTVSGKLNGKYFYRVRIEEGDWSEPVLVTVEHYKLSTAFLFLGLGAIVFLATAVLVIRGHLKHRKEFGTANA